jgi:hypothetical protein
MQINLVLLLATYCQGEFLVFNFCEMNGVALWSVRLSWLVKNSFLIRSEATFLRLCLGASLSYCLKKEDGGTDGDVEGI